MKLKVKVKPGSEKPGIEKKGDEYLVNVKAGAEHNKANIELIKILGKFFDVPVNSVKIKSGKTGRKKIIEIK